MSRQPKSVLNPTTQINKLCQPSGGPTKPMASTDYLLNLNKSKLGAYYWLFVIMKKSGCRVSKALNIRVAAISPEGRILIKGLKRGKDRVIEMRDILDYVKIRVPKCDVLFHGLNRFTGYRLLKDIGIGRLKKGRKHRSVTHIFRDDFVKDVRATIATDRATSDAIGHKSIKSTEYYGKD